MTANLSGRAVKRDRSGPGTLRRSGCNATSILYMCGKCQRHLALMYSTFSDTIAYLEDRPQYLKSDKSDDGINSLASWR